MISFRRIAVLLPCLLAPMAASAGVVDDIRQAYQSGNAAQAYQLGLARVVEMEGDPEFDYAFGLAAIDAGHLSQGVFALERVLMLRPNDHRARLELARGYFLLEQYERARREFEAVRAVEPPESVRDNIARFLDIIRVKEGAYKATTGLTLDIDRGWDSNVNSAPFSPTFSTPVLGVGTLGAGSTQLGDWYTEINAGGSLTLPLAPGRHLRASLDLHHHANDAHDTFDTDAQTLGLTLTDKRDAFETRVALRAQNYELDHSTYRNLASLSVDLSTHLSASTQLSGFLSYTNQHFPGADVRDSDTVIAGLGAAHAFTALPGRPVGFLTAYLGGETPHERSTAASSVAKRDIVGLSGGLLWTPDERTTLNTTLAWQNSRYQGVNTLFLARREDDFGSLGVTLKYRLDDRWALSGKLSASVNDSNLPINRYDREQFAVNLRYEY